MKLREFEDFWAGFWNWNLKYMCCESDLVSLPFSHTQIHAPLPAPITSIFNIQTQTTADAHSLLSDRSWAHIHRSLISNAPTKYISHGCHHAHSVYIPVCIRGVELRARCDRQRLTVEKDVFMFTVIHAHTHIHRVLQNRALISPQEIYERTRHLYIIYKAPACYIHNSLKTCSAAVKAQNNTAIPWSDFAELSFCEAYIM